MLLRQPRTLLWQLGLALMAVQLAAVVFLGLYAAARFNQFTREQADRELQRVLPLLAQRYEDALASSAPTLDEIVKADGRRTGLRITIIAADGTVRADSDAAPHTMESHAGRPEVVAAWRDGAGWATRHSATTDRDTTYFAQRIAENTPAPAVVRAGLPLALLNAEPAQLMRLVGTAALISLALTLAVIYFMSWHLSRTVSRLADGAARFAAGDLSHRVPRPSSSELATLADALNDMALRLSDQIDLLRAQRSEQQAIHQSMSNGMIALDLNQRVISINRAAEKLLMLDGAKARGRLLQELVREPELNRFIDEAIAGAPQTESEFHLRGGGARVQAVAEPLRNARDQPVGLLVFITDVTQLRKLESIRSDFAANVSHELRTPITNIRGYVETMLDVGVKNEKQTRKFLEVIGRNTQRLSSIIEDLLALARLEQPDTKAALEMSEIPVQRVLEAAVAQYDDEADAKFMDVRLEVSPSLTIIANPHLLEQAVGNLLSNAIRYGPPNTTVTIEGRQRDSRGEIEIAVADEGPGIPAQHHARIFERFYRIDRARSRAMGGTGLGLSIVKHIALVHGGRVEVQSEVGKGSVFRIILPAVAASVASRAG